MYIVRTKISFDPPPGTYARRFHKVLRPAHEAGAWFWFRNFLPGHFEPGATARYAYKKRSRKWLRDPRKRGLPSLVWLGDTKSQATEGPRIRGFPSRVRITLTTPSYVRQVPNKRNAPNMREEIFRVHGSERARIYWAMKQKAYTELRRMGEKRTVVIG